MIHGLLLASAPTGWGPAVLVTSTVTVTQPGSTKSKLTPCCGCPPAPCDIPCTAVCTRRGWSAAVGPLGGVGLAQFCPEVHHLSVKRCSSKKILLLRLVFVKICNDVRWCDY